MQKSTSVRVVAARALAGLALATFALGVLAQQSASKVPDDPAPPPAKSQPGTAGATVPGIQGQNIFEVKPDASSDPNYAKQSNAERGKVQPGNNAPMWRGVGAGAEGFTSLPKSQAPEAGVLIQPQVQYPGSRLTTAGEAWRQVRNNWILPYGGALLLIVLGALALMYFGKGPIGHDPQDTGRKIERFTPFERSTHWANAIAFCVLGISGVVMAFGKFFLLPIIGGTLFGWLTYALKTMHNFVGPLFVVSLAIMFFTFVRSNLPERGDLQWLLKGGGMFGGGHVPSNRFNAGEKGVFWLGVFALGIFVVASGLFLDKLVPNMTYDRANMQVAHMVHAIASVLMLTVFLGHIYMGSVGVKGSYQAMRTGYVDESWAKEHHQYWYDDVQTGKIPAQRSKLAEPPADAVRTA